MQIYRYNCSCPFFPRYNSTLTMRTWSRSRFNQSQPISKLWHNPRVKPNPPSSGTNQFRFIYGVLTKLQVQTIVPVYIWSTDKTTGTNHTLKTTNSWVQLKKKQEIQKFSGPNEEKTRNSQVQMKKKHRIPGSTIQMVKTGNFWIRMIPKIGNSRI